MEILPQFVSITLGVLAEDGIDSYQPTLLDVAQHHVAVLSEIPPDVDQRVAVQEWIAKKGPPDDYVFAVRSDENSVTAGHCVRGRCRFVLIRAAGETFEPVDITKPAWWTLLD